MESFSESIIIKSSPGAAFSYLGNPQTATLIDPAVIYYRPEHLPMGVGIRNHIKARVYGFSMKMVTETKVWEEGRRMVIESVKPSRPLKGIATHMFEPHELGTLYTWSMEIIPTSLGGNLAAKLFRRFMQKNARKQQARFKEIMETASG